MKTSTPRVPLSFAFSGDEIPRSNQLTPDALQAIIERISFGGLP